MPPAAVKLQTHKGVGIKTEPDRAGCEPGFKRADKPLSPLRFIAFACRGRGSIVAVEVEVAAQHFKLRAFKKALRRFVRQDRSGSAGGEYEQAARQPGPEVLRGKS